jgi:hypothetical protein
VGERRYLSLAAVVGMCVIGLSILNGCGGGDGGAGEQRTEVERIVKGGLNRKLGRLLNESATVKRVTCTRAGGHRYECIAYASEPAGGEATKTVPILVAATCDDQNCLWRVQFIAAEGAAQRLPSPESLAWVRITCKEVNRAVAQQDSEWLDQAGRAVAVQALTMRPDASADQLAAAGTRNLVRVCGQASNADYEPYVEANTALLRTSGG